MIELPHTLTAASSRAQPFFRRSEGSPAHRTRSVKRCSRRSGHIRPSSKRSEIAIPLSWFPRPATNRPAASPLATSFTLTPAPTCNKVLPFSPLPTRPLDEVLKENYMPTHTALREKTSPENSRRPTNLAANLDKRLLNYATAASAAGVWIGSPSLSPPKPKSFIPNQPAHHRERSLCPTRRQQRWRLPTSASTMSKPRCRA